MAVAHSKFGVSESLWAIIARSAREFDETGDWVSFDTLAYEAADQDAPFDLNEVFKVPAVLGGVWTGEKVCLTALGLFVAGTAPLTVETMTRLVEICAERKLRLKHDAKISRDILVAEYGFDAQAATQAVDLVQLVPGLSGGGALGEEWNLSIFRGALQYRSVHSVDDLRAVLERQAEERIVAHERALAAAPRFASPAMPTGTDHAPHQSPEETAAERATDPAAVMVVHGRDDGARSALWSFLCELGLHPLEWDELVASTGQGSPFIGQVLDAAFAAAQAVVVLLTPDDEARLHGDLVRAGELDWEKVLTCQPRPNVLFEAGMAFGFNPTRTILVEIGELRQVTDIAGRHTVRVGTQATLQTLAYRLECAGCPVDRSKPELFDPERFAGLSARTRHARGAVP